MTLFTNAASVAIAAACLFSTNASASPAREPVSVRVSGSGLDLTSDAGRRAFQRRVRSAITAACEPHDNGLDAFADARRCRDEMIADASGKMAAILARPGTQLASTGAAL